MTDCFWDQCFYTATPAGGVVRSCVFWGIGVCFYSNIVSPVVPNTATNPEKMRLCSLRQFISSYLCLHPRVLAPIPTHPYHHVHVCCGCSSFIESLRTYHTNLLGRGVEGVKSWIVKFADDSSSHLLSLSPHLTDPVASLSGNVFTPLCACASGLGCEGFEQFEMLLLALLPHQHPPQLPLSLSPSHHSHNPTPLLPSPHTPHHHIPFIYFPPPHTRPTHILRAPLLFLLRLSLFLVLLFFLFISPPHTPIPSRIQPTTHHRSPWCTHSPSHQSARVPCNLHGSGRPPMVRRSTSIIFSSLNFPTHHPQHTPSHSPPDRPSLPLG